MLPPVRTSRMDLAALGRAIGTRNLFQSGLGLALHLGNGPDFGSRHAANVRHDKDEARREALMYARTAREYAQHSADVANRQAFEERQQADRQKWSEGQQTERLSAAEGRTAATAEERDRARHDAEQARHDLEAFKEANRLARPAAAPKQAEVDRVEESRRRHNEEQLRTETTALPGLGGTFGDDEELRADVEAHPSKYGTEQARKDADVAHRGEMDTARASARKDAAERRVAAAAESKRRYEEGVARGEAKTTATDKAKHQRLVQHFYDADTKRMEKAQGVAGLGALNFPDLYHADGTPMTDAEIRASAEDRATKLEKGETPAPAPTGMNGVHDDAERRAEQAKRAGKGGAGGTDPSGGGGAGEQTYAPGTDPTAPPEEVLPVPGLGAAAPPPSNIRLDPETADMEARRTREPAGPFRPTVRDYSGGGSGSTPLPDRWSSMVHTPGQPGPSLDERTGAPIHGDVGPDGMPSGTYNERVVATPLPSLGAKRYVAAGGFDSPTPWATSDAGAVASDGSGPMLRGEDGVYRADRSNPPAASVSQHDRARTLLAGTDDPQERARLLQGFHDDPTEAQRRGIDLAALEREFGGA